MGEGDSTHGLHTSLLYAQLKARALKALDLLLKQQASVACFLDSGLLPSLVQMAQPSMLKMDSSGVDKLEEKASMLDEKCVEFGADFVVAACEISKEKDKTAEEGEKPKEETEEELERRLRRQAKGKEKGISSFRYLIPVFTTSKFFLFC